MAKGGRLERKVCKLLSTWWDPTAEDVLFWRTAGSGGRATRRRKRATPAKTAHAHVGDVGAIDERGRDLTRLVTFECKKGYKAASLHDLLDRGKAVPDYDEWIDQARTAADVAGTPYWAIVHGRTGRPLVFVAPADLFELLGCVPELPLPHLRLTVYDKKRPAPLRLMAVQFEAFLKAVPPARVRKLVEKLAA